MESAADESPYPINSITFDQTLLCIYREYIWSREQRVMLPFLSSEDNKEYGFKLMKLLMQLHPSLPEIAYGPKPEPPFLRKEASSLQLFFSGWRQLLCCQDKATLLEFRFGCDKRANALPRTERVHSCLCEVVSPIFYCSNWRKVMRLLSLTPVVPNPVLSWFFESWRGPLRFRVRKMFSVGSWMPFLIV